MITSALQNRGSMPRCKEIHFPGFSGRRQGGSALVKPVPDDEEHLSSLSVYKQQPLGGVVQQDAHSGGTAQSHGHKLTMPL